MYLLFLDLNTLLAAGKASLAIDRICFCPGLICQELSLSADAFQPASPLHTNHNLW